eukprot:TRINITY_DN5619_c0_g1_i1.p1 TRINITY_DN5619_c0_g1~~TRINITY_DN5619_c0_g1_i1.p1  ORF type:complete len:639 (+),score=152.33 TRINITY_DN5619_c0_g1_i1:74-1990(+)
MASGDSSEVPKEEEQTKSSEKEEEETVLSKRFFEEDSEHKSSKKRKLRALQDEKYYLDQLPSSELYEMSYMHRDDVTHVIITKETDFLITGSKDGVVKFWKKVDQGIEFVKVFRAHLGPIVSMAASVDGLLLCTVSTDRVLKVFDVLNFDMIHQIELDFVPLTCCWIHPPNAAKAVIAVSSRDNGNISLFKANSGRVPLHVLDSLHFSSVIMMRYNSKYNAVVSVDSKGNLEYWDADTYEIPRACTFQFKSETSLFEFARLKVAVQSLEFSPDGEMFVTLSRDAKIRIFKFLTGKIFKVYDDSIELFDQSQKDETSIYRLDLIDFGRRVAVEREISKAGDTVPSPNVIFDASSNFILWPTMLGIKIVSIYSNKLVRLLGKLENTQRFLRIALFQGKPKQVGASVVQSLGLSAVTASASAVARTPEDPMIVCTAYKKERFYMFTNRPPHEPDAHTGLGRDVQNERPIHEEEKVVSQATTASRFGRNAVVHTTMGDVHIRLYPEECPKTVENFATHSRNGYYNGCIFHRVIRNFMIQTGDPRGDGTGGESIWGGEFPDEFHKSLRHDRPFTVSMANAGPNTNGSQFFITTVPCPWLDGKHTVFGRVTKGMDVVQAIEKVKTDSDDRPLAEIKVININITD